MARVTGYECDVCKDFSSTQSDWVRLASYADKDNSGIDICSNRCLLTLAKERYAATRESEPRRRPQRERRVHSDEFKLEVLAYIEQGHSHFEAGRKFDISPGLARTWVEKMGGS
jgi:hypothetical protein